MDAIIVALLYAPWVLVFISVLGTIIHTADEIWGGDEPFWEYAEGITQIFVSWHTGFLAFCGLATVLIGLAIGGYIYGSVALLSILVGARLGDAIVSHGVLAVFYKRNNPGLWSSLYYVGEALLVFAIGFNIELKYFMIGFSTFALFWAFNCIWNKL